ncbi:ubiquitin-conjugating enzyme E2 L5 isoform X1 [Parus major]|uniref:ubiquitin-conjugating enzyme E2 L5 isoform X1 n=1 Tax=Parus major TaxID=9157 RepID=UPI001443E3C8|nr:ubiquitin-conjugating enzyme E2 L5 isoform X1 [Parus major]
MAGRIAKELEEARRWEGARDVRPLDGNVRRWGGLLLPPPAGAPMRHPPNSHLPPQRGPRGPRLPAPHLPHALGAHHPCHPRWVPREQEHSAGGSPSDQRPAPAVLQDLLLQLDSPDPQRVLRPDLARELQERPEEFWRRAEEHTRLHAEPRPDTHT